MKVPPFLFRLGYVIALGSLILAIGIASVWVYRLATTPLILQAQELLDAGKTDRAIGILEHFLETSPGHADAPRGRQILARTFIDLMNRKKHWPEKDLNQVWDLLPQNDPLWGPTTQDIAMGVARGQEQENRLRLAENAYRTVLQKGGAANLGRELSQIIMRRDPDNVNDALQWLDRAIDGAQNPNEKASLLFQKGQHQAVAWFHKVGLDQAERSVIPFSKLEALLKPAAPLRNAAIQSMKEFLSLDKTTTSVPDRIQAHLLSTRIFLRQASNEQSLLERTLSQHTPSESNLDPQRKNIQDILGRGLAQIDALLLERMEVHDRQQALLLRGTIQRRLGNHSASEKSFAKVLDLVDDQDSAPPEIRLAYLKALIGRAQVELASGELEATRATLKRIESMEDLPASVSLLAAQVVQNLLVQTVKRIDQDATTTISRLETLRRPRSEIEQVQEKAATETRLHSLQLRKRAATLFWNAALQADPTDEDEIRRDAAWEASILFRTLNQYAPEKQSIDLFLQSTGTDGRISEAYFRAGMTCQHLGQLQDAESFHNQNIEAFPETPWSHRSRLSRGQIFALSGNTEQAAQTYQEILDAPNFSPRSDIWRESLFALAELRYQQVIDPTPSGATNKAPAPGTPSADPNPNEKVESTTTKPEVSIQEALRLHKEFLGRYGPQKSVPGATDPRSPLCRFRLAVLALLENRPETALRHFQTVSELSNTSMDPIVITASYLLGDVRMRMARKQSDLTQRESLYRLSLQDYEKAARRFPDAHQARAWAYHRMGRIYETLQDPNQGRRYQELALALYNDLTKKLPGTSDPFGPDYWLQFIRWTESKRS